MPVRSEVRSLFLTFASFTMERSLESFLRLNSSFYRFFAIEQKKYLVNRVMIVQWKWSNSFNLGRLAWTQIKNYILQNKTALFDGQPISPLHFRNWFRRFRNVKQKSLRYRRFYVAELLKSRNIRILNCKGEQYFF